MPEEEMTTTAIQMPRALIERIKVAAEADDRSMAYIIRKAVSEYLDKFEKDLLPSSNNKPAKKSA